MSRFIGFASILLLATPVAAENTADLGAADKPTVATVIGGTSVPAGKWPDVVAVLGQGSCTGTLIAPDVVLTAGHCVDMGITSVVANTLDYQAAGGTKATVKSVTAYPNWETTYDVAVIVLNAPMAGVTPRKIGTACTFEGFAANTQVHLVGFGLTDTAGQGNNTRLNEAMSPITDPDCSGAGGCSAGARPGGEFIAGGAGTDSCYGDSGGPVYLDTPRGPIVIGAVSRGLDGSATPCGGGGIYVRTDKVVQWIETTAGKAVEKDNCLASPPPDGDGDGDGDGNGGGGGGGGGGDGLGGGDISGGCSSSGGSGGLGGLLVIGLALAGRRYRARR